MKTKMYTLATSLALALAVPALADSVWVQSPSVNILEGKGSIYPVVASAKKGTELQVVSRDGKWVQVQIPGGKTGWVFDSALSAQKVSADLFTINENAAGVNTSAAARGFDPAAEQYAASKHMSQAPLQHLVDLKKRISPAEWEAFSKSVQSGAPAPANR